MVFTGQSLVYSATIHPVDSLLSRKREFMPPYRFFLIASLLLGFAACVPPPPSAPVIDAAALKQQAEAQFAAEVATLPGAEPLAVSGKTVAAVAYPPGSLFAEGAILPLPGGPALLDPLSAILARPEWCAELALYGTRGGSVEDDQSFVEGRKMLLERYLLRGKVDANRFTWTAKGGAGAPLEIRFHPCSAASSAGVKE